MARECPAISGRLFLPREHRLTPILKISAGASRLRPIRDMNALSAAELDRIRLANSVILARIYFGLQ